MSSPNANDPRLDRLVRFDERSRNYPVTAALPDRKPRSYTWRCRQWYDQGREGQCVAYSLAHEASARPAEVGPVATDTIRGWYYDAQRIDPWPGGEYPGATPTYSGTSVLAGAKVGQRAGLFTGYRWAFNLDEVVATLGYLGPVILGVAWYESMYQPDREGVIRPQGRVVGGHAILARGVSVPRRMVRLRNSWGKDWGADGDCFISFDDLASLLADDGECCVPEGRRAFGPSSAGEPA